MSRMAIFAQAGEADGGSAAVVKHLQLHVWPLLGIQPDVADALMAWVHFRQVCSRAEDTSCMYAHVHDRGPVLLTARTQHAHRSVCESKTSRQVPCNMDIRPHNVRSP